jgi:hypothetical protein
VSNPAYALTIESLTGPLLWLGALTVLGLLMDAWGRRKGEPEPPIRPDLHNQVETMMRHKPRVLAGKGTGTPPKRI